jgi:hypothetical protein
MAVDYPAMRDKVFERYPYLRSSYFERRMLFERSSAGSPALNLSEVSCGRASAAPGA